MVDKKEFLSVLETMAKTPAPSGMEEKRVAFCLDWFKKNGVEAYSDEAKNVIVKIGNVDGGNATAFLAHTDVVFPDLTELPYYDDGEKIHAPGIADDTVHAVQLMFIARKLVAEKVQPKHGMLIVLNSCEEGLGNLKGVKQIMHDFEGKIKYLISVDGSYNHVVNRAVGSERYRVTIRTEGGHSYGAFGRANAIEKASRIICDLYDIKVPEREDTKTTYNVGQISGGTSVNTIAQSAEFLYEFRSDDSECIDIMRTAFEEVIKKHKDLGIDVEVEILGIRPCGKNVNEEELAALTKRIQKLSEEVTGIVPCKAASGSTDSNIPLSLGVSSVTMGGSIAWGAHRREEWVNKESIFIGFELVEKTVRDFLDE
ncbi:MAG: M20/M25/M40 family metallo-hydrolase [Oscillospiraceae bacterium]|nr:M20/M25/M40 family metallo-hydrolase [Oscillospiraceae bacterium]